MAKTFAAVIFLLGMVNQGWADDLLPLNDGLFVTDPRLCDIDREGMYHAYGDGVGMYTLNVEGTTLTSYESSCDTSRLDGMGNYISFVGLCHGEGEEWEVNYTYKIPNKDSFTDDSGNGRTFVRCGSKLTTDPNTPSTSDLIEDWQKANSTCRGSSEAELSMPACGKRDVYDELLEQRHWCYSQEHWSGADNMWHVCRDDVTTTAQ